MAEKHKKIKKNSRPILLFRWKSNEAEEERKKNKVEKETNKKRGQKNLF